GAQSDVRGLLDAADEVARHAGREAFAADEDVDLARGLREEHRGLTSGVAAADDDDVVRFAALGLDESRAVVDAGAFEALELGDLELSVLRAGGDDDGARADTLAALELDAIGDAVAVESDRGARDGEVRAEFFCLGEGALGEGLAGNAGGEAEVVLDLGARSG